MSDHETVSVDVRPALDAEPPPAVVPGRLRRPLVHIVDGAVEDETVRQFAEAFHAHSRDLERFGDDVGEYVYGWELPGIEELAADAVQRTWTAALAAVEDAREEIGVPDFNLSHTTASAHLYHHGGLCAWADHITGPDGEPDYTRRVGFHLFLSADPRMFKGGEMGVVAGELIEPLCKRLVIFHPLQVQRVQRVECLSPEPLHGRWSISGWLHGDPPEGYRETVEAFRRSTR